MNILQIALLSVWWMLYGAIGVCSAIGLFGAWKNAKSRIESFMTVNLTLIFVVGWAYIALGMASIIIKYTGG